MGPGGPTDERFHVILVEPEIAGNVGAVGRTCVAAGAMLWLIRPLGFLMTDRHIKRAGLDYWPHLDWRVVDHLDEVAEALGPDRLWLFSTKAATPYTGATYTHGDGLVFGPESRGLPESWLEGQPDRALRIPIRAEARSLNLSNSVAIGLFEAVRQVGEGPGRPQGVRSGITDVRRFNPEGAGRPWIEDRCPCPREPDWPVCGRS